MLPLLSSVWRQLIFRSAFHRRDGQRNADIIIDRKILVGRNRDLFNRAAKAAKEAFWPFLLAAAVLIMFISTMADRYRLPWIIRCYSSLFHLFWQAFISYSCSPAGHTHSYYLSQICVFPRRYYWWQQVYQRWTPQERLRSFPCFYQRWSCFYWPQKIEQIHLQGCWQSSLSGKRKQQTRMCNLLTFPFHYHLLPAGTSWELFSSLKHKNSYHMYLYTVF